MLPRARCWTESTGRSDCPRNEAGHCIRAVVHKWAMAAGMFQTTPSPTEARKLRQSGPRNVHLARLGRVHGLHNEQHGAIHCAKPPTTSSPPPKKNKQKTHPKIPNHPTPKLPSFPCRRQRARKTRFNPKPGTKIWFGRLPQKERKQVEHCLLGLSFPEK